MVIHICTHACPQSQVYHQLKHSSDKATYLGLGSTKFKNNHYLYKEMHLLLRMVRGYLTPLLLQCTPL